MKTTLKFWVMPNGAFNSFRLTHREIKLFNKFYPDIEIQFDVLPWTHAWDRIITAVKNKNGPDIVQIGNSWTSQLSVFNAFKDLTKKSKVIQKENFAPQLWDMCIKPGTTSIVSIPWFLDLRVQYYRKDILNKFGFSPDDIGTYDGFREVCRKIHNQKINRKAVSAYGLSRYIDPLFVQDLASWIWNFGGDFFSPDQKTFLLNSKKTYEGIKFYFDIINEFSASETQFSYTHLADNFFENEKYGFISMSAWPLPKYFNKKSEFFEQRYIDKFDIMMIPEGPADGVSFCGGSNLSIMEYSNHVDEAFEFIRFLTSVESQIRYCKNIYMLPCNIDAFDSVLSIKSKYIRTLKETYLNSRGFPVHPLWGSIEIILGEMCSRINNSINMKKYTTAYLRQELKRVNSEIQYLIDL